MIDVFLRRHSKELSAKEVSELAGISVSTFHRNIDVLTTIGLVKKVRDSHQTQLYRLNKENDISKSLRGAQRALLKHTRAVAGQTERSEIPDLIEDIHAKNSDDYEDKDEDSPHERNIAGKKLGMTG